LGESDHSGFEYTFHRLPWDEDDDGEEDGVDWVEHHLDNRFAIYTGFMENS
jgi:hypothetical protein